MTEAGRLSGWKGWLVAVIVPLLSVASRFFHLNTPLERDEGAYAYMADVIQRGGLPYLNAFDHKPPLIYYFYWLSCQLFGHTASAPRLLAALFVAAACFVLLLLVYRETKNLPAALFSSFLLGMASSSPAYLGLSANTELFTLPFLLGGLFFLATEAPLPQHFFFAGLLFGCGFLVKQPVAVIALFPLLFHGVRRLKMPLQLLRIFALSGVGAMVPLGAAALFFYLRGGFTSFLEGCFTYNFGYLEKVPLDVSMTMLTAALKQIIAFDAVTWIAGAGGLFVMLTASYRPFIKWYGVVLLIGSVLAVAMGRYFYPHYFIFMLPVLALTAGVGLAGMLRRGPAAYVRRGAVLLACVAAASGLRFAALPEKEIVRLSYHNNTFLQSRSMGDYLRAQAFPGVTAFIIGSEPEILFYAGLPSVSRIYYTYPLVTPTKMMAELRRETVADLLRRPPDFVVFVNKTQSIGIKKGSNDTFVNELCHRFSTYRIAGVIADNSDIVQSGDDQQLRSVISEGAAMLLLERSDDNPPGRLTFGEFLQKRGI